MAIDDVVTKRSSRRITLPIGAAIFATALAAQQAKAQDSFDDPNTKRNKTEEVVKPEQPEQSGNRDFLSGYLGAEYGHSENEDSIFAKGKFTINPGKGWRMSAYMLGGWQDFDNELKAQNFEGRVGVGKYFFESPKFDLYTELSAGYGHSKLSETIDLDLDRFMFGGKFGVASRDIGTKFELDIYKGIGDMDYTLLSGKEDSDKFDSFFASADFTQRLFGSNKKTFRRGEFDVRGLGEDFEQSFFVGLKAFYSNDEYKGLLEDRGFGIEASGTYVYNFRKTMEDSQGNILADGMLLRLSPFLQYERHENDSPQSVRETESSRFRLGARVELELTKWLALRVEGGYEWYKLDIDDPVRGNDRDDKNGFAAGAGIYLKW
jgi:hypothetical protein